MIVYHPSSFFEGKKILLGVTGGIAAVKVVSLARYLTEKGARVTTCMTRHALRIVGRVSFEAVTGERVYVDSFAEGASLAHIALARSHDLILVVPATANIIGKMAHGIADDLLSTLLLVEPQKVLLAPAMNVSMWRNPVVQENVRILMERGVGVIPPSSGKLACGEEGEGRLPEIEEIVEAIFQALHTPRDLTGKKILITAGATREWLDPVRFVSNPSSGLMGCALASVCRAWGGEVKLVTGVLSTRVPFGVVQEKAETALAMREAVLRSFDWCDVLIMCAAVSDFRPIAFSPVKLKKNNDGVYTLSLVPNPDILQEVGERKGTKLIVGFCAETENVLEEAWRKLRAKNADVMVANLVGQEGTGFAVPTNRVWIVDRKGNEVAFPLLPKTDVAERIVSHLVAHFLS
ncbi:bifunctional phosphopantothenoylcysteine decarboxylase/phosphopantothenate--cysteine ligase CoaBC [Candidatus Caldatribacterium sp.]|uniref:bifunctional phosphopantothenoylcysteine decarboxylase/phosphopantothenate--cysteine ligase CoaBC n=1 Tax=Candidatus Caldatribacterium sp. TaxID=2282143 RepID=UPI002992921F|nr:bifunctional phosphopantothenoylcysteine decarboxylase/phosphopantothenate--cysteine ligase CoaBC [Candidatus Caldatribacterium sp.]MDW8080467.1 bifunctional phosphopantothenoylcysteine decarboxylase/phosphopantothenate--cysteine ligase CoaBC [Candidatus Calescibacterium sp.]